MKNFAVWAFHEKQNNLLYSQTKQFTLLLDSHIIYFCRMVFFLLQKLQINKNKNLQEFNGFVGVSFD